MVVTEVILSGIALKLRVDRLVITTVTLADSNMMMQLCRPKWEGKIFQQCAYLLATAIKPCLVGQHIVKLQLHKITCAADGIAACKYEGSAGSSGKW